MVTPFRMLAKAKVNCCSMEMVSEILPELLGVGPIFDYAKYSSLKKLLTVIKFVFKFIKKCRPNVSLPQPIVYWIKFVQRIHYPSSYTFLSNKVDVLDQASKQFIKDLCLYLDGSNRLICSRGRLHHSTLDQSTKFPFLIPTESQLAGMLVVNAHLDCLYEGV